MSTSDIALNFLDFWLSAGPSKWFNGGAAFDDKCRAYEGLWEEASKGAYDDWANSATGALSLIILLDQIPRNIFRDDAKQFSTDDKALEIARTALKKGFDRSQILPVRNFYYLPFMHSEDITDQRICCDKLRVLNDQNQYYWALVHMDAIARFGRFPHRNKILGRETTESEKEYLATGGFGA